MTQPTTAVQEEFRRVSSASWSMEFPFQPYNGGEGAALVCTTTSSRVKLLGDYGAVPNENVNVVVIYNTGSVAAFIRFETLAVGGSPSVVALVSSMAIPPGSVYTGTLPGATAATDVYVNGITSTGTTTLQITTGFGM